MVSRIVASEPNLDLELDPKTTWALRNRSIFPIDINTAARQMLLRIPGVGARSVDRMLAARRWHRLRLMDLVRLKVAMTRAMPFILTADHNPLVRALDTVDLRTRLLGRRTQLDLFSAPLSVVSGEL
jgi:predicted DNA-binding helix-hairpin-helix protein